MQHTDKEDSVPSDKEDNVPIIIPTSGLGATPYRDKDISNYRSKTFRGIMVRVIMVNLGRI